MTLSAAAASYDDVRGLMDRALEAPTGVRVKFADEAQAFNIRHRAYSLRKIDRANNRKIFKEGDPLYGKSPYDKLMVSIEGSTLVIQKAVGNFTVEDF